MKNVTNLLYVQLFYMLGMVSGFLLVPNLALPVFGFYTTEEMWIRVLGALVIAFASYYCACIECDTCHTLRQRCGVVIGFVDAE
jgi:hypothetical protein